VLLCMPSYRVTSSTALALVMMDPKPGLVWQMGHYWSDQGLMDIRWP
jgi:hypothetical protein